MPIDPKIIQSLIEDKDNSDLKNIVRKLQDIEPDLQKLDLAGIKKEDLIFLLKSRRLKDLIPKLANNDPDIKKLDLTAIDQEGLKTILEAVRHNSYVSEIENLSKELENEEDLISLLKILRKNIVPRLENNDPDLKKLDLTAITKEELNSILKAVKFNSYVTEIENLNKDLENEYDARERFRIKTLQNKIIQAADRGSLESLQTILNDEGLLNKNGAINKIRDSRGRNILYIAAANNHGKTLVLLNELGAKPEPADNGMTAVHAAIARGHEEALYFLMNSDEKIINHTDKNGRAPIHILAENKIEIDESKIAEENSADEVDQSQNSQIPPLEERLNTARDLKADHMISALKLHKADLDLLTTKSSILNQKEEETSFFIAAKTSNLPVIKALSKAKADINKPTTLGNLPILVAIDNGHYKAADLLMKCGANIYEAICLATKNNNNNAVNYLMDKNPDATLRAICIAASRKRYGSKIIKTLVGKEKGSKEFKDILIKAFKEAAQYNYYKAIPRLLKNIGSDFAQDNIFNKEDHRSIITNAAQYGSVEFIKALKENKFKINYTEANKTPLQLALEVRQSKEPKPTSLREVKDKKKVDSNRTLYSPTSLISSNAYEEVKSSPIIQEPDYIDQNRQRVSIRIESLLFNLQTPNISTEDLRKMIIEYILRNLEKEDEIKKLFKSVIIVLNKSAESIEELQKEANLDTETRNELEMINMKDELKMFYLCNRRLLSQFLVTAFVVGGGVIKADNTSVVNDGLGKFVDISKLVCSTVGGFNIPIVKTFSDFFSTALSESRKRMNQYKMNNAVSLLTDPVECSKFAEFVSRKLTLLKAHQIAGDLENKSEGTLKRIEGFLARNVLGESDKEQLFRTMDEICEKDINKIVKKLTASENRTDMDSDLKRIVLEDIGYTVVQIEGNKSLLRIELEKHKRIQAEEMRRLNNNEMVIEGNNLEHLTFSINNSTATATVREVVEPDSNSSSTSPTIPSSSTSELKSHTTISPTLSPVSSNATPIIPNTNDLNSSR